MHILTAASYGVCLETLVNEGLRNFSEDAYYLKFVVSISVSFLDRFSF